MPARPPSRAKDLPGHGARTGTASLPCGGCGAEKLLVTPSSRQVFQFPFRLSDGSCPCPALTGLCHPISPHPSQSWLREKPRLLQRWQNPQPQRTRGPRHRPKTAAPSSLPAAACAREAASGAGAGAKLPHTGGTDTPSQQQTSPRGSSEARFTPSSWTFLLLPGSLGRRRHRADSQRCPPHPVARTSPRAAYSQADVSGFSLRFRALPQTARAKRGQVLGQGFGGKGAAHLHPVL